MPPKRVTVLFRGTPFANRRVAEGLRMSVGQTLADHHVRLIFVGDAVYTLGEANPSLLGGGEIKLPLETLAMLGGDVVAERESFETRKIRVIYPFVRFVSREEIAHLLLESEAVITW